MGWNFTSMKKKELRELATEALKFLVHPDNIQYPIITDGIVFGAEKTAEQLRQEMEHRISRVENYEKIRDKLKKIAES